MVAHGLITGLLFFLADRCPIAITQGDGAARGNLNSSDPGQQPRVHRLRLVGLPGLAGFGEFMSLLVPITRRRGFHDPFPGGDGAGAIGTVLTAGYMLCDAPKVNLGSQMSNGKGHQFHE